MKVSKNVLKAVKMLLRVGISTFTLWFYLMLVYVHQNKSEHTLVILVLSLLFTLLLQDWDFIKKLKEDKAKDEPRV